jgi:hypothetical protein
MALANYETLTQALLQAPSSPVPLIATATLDTYINQARLQVAAQGRCVRQYATLPLVAGQQIYPFSAITGLSASGTPPAASVGGIYHIRQAWMQIPGVIGQTIMYPRPFEWFGQFVLNKFNPQQAQPKRWAQFGQGEEGSIFVDPIPDLPYTLAIDALGVPVTLTSDSTPEAIPDIWTLAVPFYAAWWGFQSAQRQSDADKMLERFEKQMALARSAANPDLMMENWSQAADPEDANRLGMQARPQ